MTSMLEIVPGSSNQTDEHTKTSAHQQTPSSLVNGSQHAPVAATDISNAQPVLANVTNQLPPSPILRFIQEDGPWSGEAPRATADQSVIINQVMADCDRLL